MMRLKYSWIVVGTVSLAVGVSVMGQAYQVHQGRLLDANNRLGSGGLNYARPAYDFNASNRIMTGNVAGGRAFRGFSPIRDSNSLFLGQPSGLGVSALSPSGLLAPALPSDQLSAFRRDSYNLSDYRKQSFGLGVGSTGYLPYYSSSSTVTNTGAIISGRNRAGTSQVLDSYQSLGTGIPVRPGDPFAASGSLVSGGSSLAVPSRLLRRSTGEPVTGEVNDRLLQSQLFGGAVRQLPLTELSSQRMREESLGSSVAAASGSVTGLVDLRVRPFGPVDTRVAASRFMDRRVETGSAFDRVLERAAADGDWQAGRTGQVLSPTDVSGEDRASGESHRGVQRSEGGPFERAGDVFARMREMSGTVPQTRLTSSATDATVRQASEVSLVHKFGGVQGVGPAGGGLVGPEPAVGDPSTAAPSLPPKVPGPDLAGEDQPLGPIKTFVGTHESMVNSYLARAEADLQAGRFYRAAEMYQLARSVAPNNPLPVLGRAMALLAAGDYMSSVSGLFEGIRLFESLSLFEIDLKTFVADLEVLDRRRADLEAHLEVSENYRLRFLLGWAEYCSGLQELGLSNMEKAMELAPPLPGDIEGPGDREASAPLGEPESREEPASPEEPGGQPEPGGRMDLRTAAELRAVRRFVQGLRQRVEGLDSPIDVPTN